MDDRWADRTRGDRVDQARVTLPARMHDVHTFSFLGVRPTRARTVWILGFQRRGVRRWE